MTGGATQCRIDGGAASSTCDLTFSDSGFFFDVPDFVSNQGTDSVTVRSLKSDETQQCVPGFQNVSKTMKLWQTYVSPASGTRMLQVNGVDVGNGATTPTTQVFAFDNSGEATFDVDYSDAGSVQLNLRYDGSGDDAGLVMSGDDQFIVSPLGLCASTTSSCLTGDAGCDPFVAAGAPFDLTVTFVGWESGSDTDICDNFTTPNYAESNLVIPSTKLSPAGGNSGVITPTFYHHVVSADGSNTISMTESEVGVFTYTVDPPDYWGVHDLGTATTAAVGRFYPKDFVVTVSEVG